jgi:hypothetical protein
MRISLIANAVIWSSVTTSDGSARCAPHGRVKPLSIEPGNLPAAEEEGREERRHQHDLDESRHHDMRCLAPEYSVK